MKTSRRVTLLQHLESLQDPRSDRNRKHRLVDIVVIVVCGVLVGCDGPTSIRLWSEHREDWLGEFLPLPNGLPSKDCLRRVLSLLDPTAFSQCFIARHMANEPRATNGSPAHVAETLHPGVH